MRQSTERLTASDVIPLTNSMCHAFLSSVHRTGNDLSPAVSKRAINAKVHLTLTAMATAVTCKKFTVICARKEMK